MCSDVALSHLGPLYQSTNPTSTTSKPINNRRPPPAARRTGSGAAPPWRPKGARVARPRRPSARRRPRSRSSHSSRRSRRNTTGSGSRRCVCLICFVGWGFHFGRGCDKSVCMNVYIRPCILPPTPSHNPPLPTHHRPPSGARPRQRSITPRWETPGSAGRPAPAAPRPWGGPRLRARQAWGCIYVGWMDVLRMGEVTRFLTLSDQSNTYTKTGGPRGAPAVDDGDQPNGARPAAAAAGQAGGGGGGAGFRRHGVCQLRVCVGLADHIHTSTTDTSLSTHTHGHSTPPRAFPSPSRRTWRAGGARCTSRYVLCVIEGMDGSRDWGVMNGVGHPRTHNHTRPSM